VEFSTSKSQIVCFNRKLYAIELPEFHLGNALLQVVDEYKYLGIIFDESGKWHSQHRSIQTRLQRSVFLIQRFISCRSAPSAQALTDLMTIPISQLEYALPFWRPNQQQLRLLRSILVQPLRRFLTLPPKAHIASMLIEFCIPSPPVIRMRSILQIASRFHKLPPSHPCATLWLEDQKSPPSTTQYCRSLFQETKEILDTLSAQLPLEGESLRALCQSADIQAFEEAKTGKALKEICVQFSQPARYLFLDDPIVLRARARLRHDLAPLNKSLHRRNLALSPLCSTCLTEESRIHVILHCPRYATARENCKARFESTGSPFNLAAVLAGPPGLSADFILQIHRTRKLI
jgi:hypothetical protein